MSGHTQGQPGLVGILLSFKIIEFWKAEMNLNLTMILLLFSSFGYSKYTVSAHTTAIQHASNMHMNFSSEDCCA